MSSFKRGLCRWVSRWVALELLRRGGRLALGVAKNFYRYTDVPIYRGGGDEKKLTECGERGQCHLRAHRPPKACIPSKHLSARCLRRDAYAADICVLIVRR